MAPDAKDFWCGVPHTKRQNSTEPLAQEWFLCGYEAHYFLCKVVNKVQREFGAAEHKRKVGAAQQRENWCCTAEREIWCCWAKRNLVQRAQEKIGAAQYLVQREEESWCEPKEAAACGSELSSEFAQLISKRDCALKPLVHTKIFSPLASTARQRVRKEGTAQTGCFYFSLPFNKISSPHTSTFLRHTILPFDCIDYFVQIAPLHNFYFCLLFNNFIIFINNTYYYLIFSSYNYIFHIYLLYFIHSM